MNPAPRVHLAQLNIARLTEPLDHPDSADFVAGLGPMNALAEASPGFIWRLVDDGGTDATALSPFEDDRVIVNMSVWESLETLRGYAFGSAHAEFLRERRRWFERPSEATTVLWWVSTGQLPTVDEAKERLGLLREKGPTAGAFTFGVVFAPTVSNSGRT